MDFFGIGFGEILLVIVLALLVFGPGKLPEISRTIGRVSRNLRKATTDFTTALDREADDLKKPLRDTAAEARRGLNDLTKPIHDASMDARRDLTLPPADAPSPPSHLPPPGTIDPKG